MNADKGRSNIYLDRIGVYRRLSAAGAVLGLLLSLMLVWPAQAATFGRAVPLLGGATEIVLDEGRGMIYLVSSLQNRIQIYSLQRQTFLAAIPTDLLPLSAALSRDGRFLYVTCFDSSLVDVIDLDRQAIATRVSLPARPEGIAVANDGRVLITTSGSGANAAANALLLYNPSVDASPILASIPVAPPAPTPPTLPPPSGRPFLANRSQLVATRDGSIIVGVNAPAAGAPVAFVYEAASASVLRSRIVAGSSTVLSVSDDGTRFMCGPNLFDAATLAVLGQLNLANAPYTFPAGTNFNVVTNQGGSVFSPDNLTLYSAFNIAPVQTPPAPPNVSQFMFTDPDNLLIRMGLQLPENLAGKMVINSAGSTVYALSDSGFLILPVGAAFQSPLAIPSSRVVLLTKDPCNASSQATDTVVIDNPGPGRVSATAQLIQTTPQPNPGLMAMAPTVRPVPAPPGSQLAFTFNNAAARGLGTIVPPHDFAIQSPEGINIPGRVRVFQNHRDSDAAGAILPIPPGTGAGEAFPDLVFDQARRRVYVANAGLNRVEVYDIASRSFLAPIKVGQLPASMALAPAGNTLYVANSGGESISIVDLDKMETVGRVSLPPLPFNSNLALVRPLVIAPGLNGPQVLMSDGRLWRVVGDSVVLRPASRLIGQTPQGLPVALPVQSVMAATPGAEYILLVTPAGFAYLYDSVADDFIAGRQLFANNTPGYVGPVAAGPQGRYFVVNGTLLNQSLVPVGTRGPGLVSAVAAVSNNNFAIYSPPPAVAANAAQANPPTIQVMDANTGNPGPQVKALEGPLLQIGVNARGLVSGRTMAVDPSGPTAYVITASGLSIIPLAQPPPSDRPLPNQRGAVNLASSQLPIAANGLLSIYGQNLGSQEVASATPLPLILGGTCVTLNNIALPLFMSSPNQINAQIPVDLAPGNYPLVVRSVSRRAASAPQQVAVTRYAPAVITDGNGQVMLLHQDGRFVTKDNPAKRDEPLTMYAVGLGPTTGGRVTTGAPSPFEPLAETGEVKVFFGNPGWVQAEVIVDWSGLAPGLVGVYQLNLRVPGFHISGDALPITLRIGGVNSPSSGPVVPTVSVN